MSINQRKTSLTDIWWWQFNQCYLLLWIKWLMMCDVRGITHRDKLTESTLDSAALTCHECFCVFKLFFWFDGNKLVCSSLSGSNWDICPRGRICPSTCQVAGNILTSWSVPLLPSNGQKSFCAELNNVTINLTIDLLEIKRDCFINYQFIRHVSQSLW